MKERLRSAWKRLRATHAWQRVRATRAWKLVRGTWREWREDDAPRVAAALAYYTMFSIAPLLLVLVAVAGIFLGDQAARGEIVGASREFIGRTGAEAIQEMVRGSSDPDAGRLALVIGVVGLIVGASSASMHLKESLNLIWDLPRRKVQGILGTLRMRVLSLAVVLTIGFLLLSSLAISALIAGLGKYLADRLRGGEVLWQALDVSLSIAVATLLFASLFKFLPDIRVEWRDVWTGAFFTALLFVAGKTAIAIWLGKRSLDSTYGAAASFMILLVWIYYSGLIFFLGAEFTQVHAKLAGRAPSAWKEEATTLEA
ncbi:MAG: YihY/virulence factor BrkB family protein [Thermoanaerobaculia bacterium]